MRIALIGLGDIAQKAYLPLLASDERVTPLLCTRNPAVLGKLARQYRIPECFTDVDALLGSRPDAVMIHAATAVHGKLAEQCLRAGIPTFVDKPLCDNAAEVEALANLAMAQDCPLFVGFNRRYLPAVSAARTDNQPLTELNWQKHRHALPGLPRQFLFDDFIHVLDSLYFYGGLPTGDLHAVLRRSSQQPELLAGVSVAWQSGQTAVSGSMNRGAGITEERVDAYGDNLSLHLENCTRGTIARDKTVQTLAAGTGPAGLRGNARSLVSANRAGQGRWGTHRELSAWPSTGRAAGGAGGLTFLLRLPCLIWRACTGE
ncbi:Gfo/Idh/MocA family oxidoreductase [Aeromonas salmonicida subsp. achromogenes]